MVNVLGVSLLLGACLLLSAQELQLNEKGCGHTIAHYIVNGTLAKKNQYPWMVFLRVYFPTFDSRCGGSIITRRHVLTAGHCTVWMEKEVVKIDATYGETDVNRGTKLKVVKIRRHSEYSASPLLNDIAILLVDKPFHYAYNAKPICVPLAPIDSFNKDAIVAGWGFLSENGPPTDHLMYTVVKILPNDICAETYKYLSYRKDINYCAHANETDACQGDSGGPLFLKGEEGEYIQAGIVSHGIGCAGEPGVYARVDAYAEWLEASVRSDEGYRDLEAENTKQPLK